MNTKTYRAILLACILLAAVFFSTACAGEESEPESPPSAPSSVDEDPAPDEDAPTTETDAAMADRDLVELKCSMCHTTERVWAVSYDKTGWESTVDRMKRNGLVLTDEEYVQIVGYLAESSEE